jgi:glycosyltransferase involved in cell wall biosynthesis
LKFSILTPSFGYGRFISDCVTSVLNQDGVDLEHIVMDGGSADETVEVLQRLADDQRLSWVSERDAGQSDALNKAVRRADGEWIGWLNADEFYLPGALKAAAATIRERPELDVVFGDFVEVNEHGHMLKLVAEHAFDERVLRAQCFIPSCGTFFRREALPDRLWDTTLPSVMDWDLFLEMWRSERRFGHVPRPMAAFRVHPAQVTGSPRGQTQEELAQLKSRYDIPVDGWRASRLRLLGRGAHVGRKLGEGGYFRQARAARLKGKDLRWFSTSDSKSLFGLGLSPSE